MAQITTRQTAGTGATVAGVPLTNAQIDTNFINLNQDIFSTRANINISGGGTISVDSSYNVGWTQRFIVISSGRSPTTVLQGYWDITLPAVSTVITGVGGATNKTVVAAGVPLAMWEALYYILPFGQGSGSVSSNFRVVNYTADVDIPSNWILLCVRNGDNGVVYFPHGINLNSNDSTVGYESSSNVANTIVARDVGGNFSAGTITAALSGNSTTASTWQTARTLTIGATGKSVNGSSNVSWSLGEIQAEYQAPKGIPINNLGSPTVREAALFEEQFNNKTDRYDITQVFIESSTDNVNWSTVSVSDTEKRKLVGGDPGSSVGIGYGTPYFRVRLRSTGYVYLDALYSFWSSNGHSTQVQIFKKHDNGTWEQHTSSTVQLGAWPGHLYLPFDTIPWNPTATLGTHWHEVYVLFTPTWNPTYSANSINLYKMQWWGGYPAGKRRLYAVDELGNATFPAGLTVTGSIAGSLSGNASTATTLQTARTINGVSFNGSANITVADSTKLPLAGGALTGTVSTTKPITSNNDINVDGSNFLVNTSTKSTALYAYEVQRSGSAVGGILINGAGAFATGTTIGGNTALHAGNYNSYSPTLTGTGASGTWSINVTGSAGSASTATNSTQLGGVAAANYISGTNGSGSRPAAVTQDVYEVAQYKSGFWDINGASWTPNTNWYWGATFAHVSNNNAYNFSGQLAFENGGGGNQVYARTISNGTPTTWSRLLSSGNYNSYSPTLTGTGASGTWGVSITGNAATATTLQTARTINGVSFNGSANISVTRVDSKGALSAETLRNVHDSGIYTFTTGNASLGDTTPISYWSTISFGSGSNGSAQIAADWISGGNNLWFRSLRDTVDNWWTWKRIYHDNYRPLADKWTTARTLTVGNTGKSVDGTANVSWTLAEIGAYAATNPSGYITSSASITGTAANVTGTVAVGNGGTGATTAQGAINALAAAVTSGSYLRGNGTNVVMSAIQAADVPILNQNTTGNAGTVTNGVYTNTTNILTGSNTFRNTGGLRVEQVATQDAIALIGRGGGSSGFTVSLVPTTLTAGRIITLPDLAGTFIVDGGSYANPAWITSLSETKVLPSQTGHSGKFLTTNGTSTSWGTAASTGKAIAMAIVFGG